MILEELSNMDNDIFKVIVKRDQLNNKNSLLLNEIKCELNIIIFNLQKFKTKDSQRQSEIKIEIKNQRRKNKQNLKSISYILI